VLPAHGILAITADHGNAELKVDPSGAPLTAHTTSPVPFILAGDDGVRALRDGGKLGDVAPTLLRVLGLTAPAEMTGEDLTVPMSPSPARAG
jgi:2,3-bisphosphoglycerate-independent phosphoglycerate mutase